MKSQRVLAWLYTVYVSAIRAYDTCWVYDYKYDWSSVPYKRQFSCPCGCCGDTWTRKCCPSLPECYHNSTIPEEYRHDTGDGGDDGTSQALMLTGIVVGTFCILLVLTALTHLCGRAFLKMDEKKDPNVVIYNMQGPQNQNELMKVEPTTSNPEKNSVHYPPSYQSATTTV